MGKMKIEMVQLEGPTGVRRELVVVLRKAIGGAEFLVMASEESLLCLGAGEVPQIELECGECSPSGLLPVRDGQILASLLSESEGALFESSSAMHSLCVP